jgi:starch synthase
MMNILHVTSEVAPFSKTGGLGDVSSALPRAQSRLDCDVRVLTPLYSCVSSFVLLKESDLHSTIQVGGEQYNVSFVQHRPDSGVVIFFLDCPKLYARTGLYMDTVQNRDYGDNDVRFIVLCRAALELCRLTNWIPDIVHGHDWQAGLTPLFLREQTADERFSQTRSAFTIHNMAYQGLFSRNALRYIPEAEKYFSFGGPIEFHGMVSFLKAAIELSDCFNTVSPTYAREIRSRNEYGFGLEDVLSANHARFRGILNGIDTVEWDPEADGKIAVRYSADFVAKKVENKKSLCNRASLSYRRSVPLIGMITRITEQKGFEIIVPIMTEILNLPVQLVVLGTGDPYYEHVMLDFANAFKDQMNVTIAYDDEYAHQIEAGADLFLMPSKYEPCGLNQMMSMRYGTLPIVRATGGLEDSVIDADAYPEYGTGFKFTDYDSTSLMKAIRSAVEAYRHPSRWRKLQRNAMAQDFSWEQSARYYLEMYQEALAKPARVI